MSGCPDCGCDLRLFLFYDFNTFQMTNTYRTYFHIIEWVSNMYILVMHRVLVCLLPANTLSYILVHLSEFGLQIGQEPVQQLWHPPLLLSQTPLQHIQMTA